MKTGSKAKLQAQFNGVSSPSEMGTTGLIAWVLAGEQFNRWDRYKVAKKVIKSRCNSGWDMCKLIALFDRAILAAAEQHGINMERFKCATAPKANKVAKPVVGQPIDVRGTPCKVTRVYACGTLECEAIHGSGFFRMTGLGF